MKRQKSAAFAKKKKKNAHKSTNDKNYCQVGNHCYYTGKYGVVHIAFVIYNVLYLKEFMLLFTID